MLRINNIDVTYQQVGNICMFASYGIIINYFSKKAIRFEQKAREGKHKEETVRKFYEQKGSPIPDDVNKWIKKGKAYKNPKTSKSQVNEDEQGYGNLFDQ